MDLLNVVIRADTSGSDRAAQSLENMTGAARQADAAVRAVGTGSGIASGAIGQTAVVTDRATASARAHAAALQAQAAASRMAVHRTAGLATQLADVGQMLALGQAPMMTALQQGPQIFSMYGNSVKGIGLAFFDMGKLALGAAKVIAGPLGAAVGAVTVLLYGFTRQINDANSANVSMVDTALAMWQSLADGVTTLLGPAFTWLADESNRAIDQITSDTSREINQIIGFFVGAVDAIRAAWGQLPDAFGYIMFEVSRTVSNEIVTMQINAMSGINNMLSSIDNAMLKVGVKTNLPRLNVHQYGIDNYKTGANPYGSAQGAADAAGQAFNDAMGRDYVGNWMGGVGSRAQEIAAARGEVEELGKASSAANDNAKKLADDGLSAAAKAAREFGDTVKGAFRSFIDDIRSGKSWIEALGNAIGGLGDKFLDLAFDAVFGDAGAGGGTGIIGAIASLFGFAQGGYTGPGGTHQVAGVVHAGEYVFSAAATSRIGVANLEALHSSAKGYAGGGYVAAAPSMAAPANNNGLTRIAVDVGVTVDDDGKVQAYVKSVSQDTVAGAAPAIVGTAVNQANRTAPSAMAKHQQQRAGGDWRTM